MNVLADETAFLSSAVFVSLRGVRVHFPEQRLLMKASLRDRRKKGRERERGKEGEEGKRERLP